MNTAALLAEITKIRGRADSLETQEYLSAESLLTRLSSALSVDNTTNETSIISFTVDASVMRTNRAVRCTILGEYKNNSGSSSTLTLRVKFGGGSPTTLYADATASNSSNAAARPVWIELVLANLDSASSQLLTGVMFMATTSAATSGTGDIGAAGTLANVFAGVSAIDTTAGQFLTVTIQHSVQNANTYFKRLYATINLI